MSMKTRFCWAVIFFWVPAPPALAQVPANVDPLSVRSVSAVHVDKAPELDGTLEDSAWKDATSISSFRQREPFERQPPSERTEVRALYDSRYLYFGVHCFDSEVKKIVATELRRDADFSVDDNFTVLISPNNDKRNGYMFTTNALGTQFDALISDEGRVNDPNWDGIWKSNALSLNGFVAKTFSADRNLRSHDWASTIDASYNSNLVQVEFFQNRVGPNFNPEVGFVDRTDIVTNSFDAQLSPRPKHGRIREYNFEAFYRRHLDTHGVLQTQEWQTTFRANFGAYTDDDLFDNFIQRLNTPFNIFKNIVIPPGLLSLRPSPIHLRIRSKQAVCL